jgi:hypothetical protein
MSDDKKDPQILDMDEAIIKRMHVKGNYIAILERFDVLRIKFIYDKLDPKEARNFMLLIKYLMKNGHSEAVRLNCHYLHKKYIESQGL